MFEIVDEIVQAERQAEQIVSEARDEAEKIRSTFDAEEREALSRAREEATETLRKRIETVREEEHRRLQETLSADESGEQFLRRNPERVGEAVDRIIELLVTPEYER
ncbi:MAG: hypothetical protein ACQETQ_11745 [Spirochaetota bacterium]